LFQQSDNWVFNILPCTFNFKGSIPSVLVCAIYAHNARYPVDEEELDWVEADLPPSVRILNKTRGNFHVFWTTYFSGPIFEGKHSFPCPKKEDHFFLYLTPLIRRKYELEGGRIFNELVMDSGDEIEVYIDFWYGSEVKKCGVHVVVDEPCSNMMQKSCSNMFLLAGSLVSIIV
jgi:hypothetical protein